MKEVILTEDYLRSIVSDKVKETLNELSISQKKRNVNDVERVFTKGQRGFSAIKALAVFTSENPDSKEMPRGFNKKVNNSLKEALKEAQYTIIPCIGQFYGNPEHPYAVVNISKESAAIYCGKYEQTSFVYTEFKEDKAYSEYWEKRDVTIPYDEEKNPYVLKDTCDTWVNRADADDGYTIVGNKFKYSIPFSIFNEANDRIVDNVSKYLLKEGKEVNETNIEKFIRFGYERIGYPAYRNRFITNKNFKVYD